MGIIVATIGGVQRGIAHRRKKAMLRTYSKKVSERVRELIANRTEDGNGEVKDFRKAVAIIAQEWGNFKNPNTAAYYDNDICKAFKSFANGLPNNLFDYIVRGDTVKLVGDMLEQTEQERAKYSDSEACDLLTYMIYSEISKVAAISF